jgi:uncharacterized membrane protein
MSDTNAPRTSAAVKGDVVIPDVYAEVTGGPIDVDLHDVWAEAWDRFAANAALLVVGYFILAAISTVLSFPVHVFSGPLHVDAELLGGSEILSTYVSSLSTYVFEAAFFDPVLTNGGMLAMALVIARGETLRLGDAFGQLRRFFPLLLAGFGAAFFAALGGMLALVPGLALMYLFSFALILVLDQNEGPLEALRGSARVCWTHARSLLLPLLGCAGLFVVGKLTCGLGMLVAGPLIALVHVGLYERSFAAARARRHNR